MAGRRARAIAAGLRQEGGWTQAVETDRLCIWRQTAAPAPIRPLPGGAGWVLGELVPRRGVAALNPSAGRDRPAVMARRLCASHWGRYVAVLPGFAACPSAIFRDPSGDLETVVWNLEGQLEIAASACADIPVWLRPPRLSLNWDRIAAFLAVPTSMPDSLFDGVEALRPGVLRSLGASSVSRETVWTPAAFAGGFRLDRDGARGALVSAVDEACAGQLGRYERVIVELSGGLDSAVIAGALGATGLDARVLQWLNRTGDRPDGDEQAFARAVTDRLGTELTVAAKPMTPFSTEDLMELGPAFWPAINGVDAARDRDECERITATGAEAIVSGQGGDAVFYQMPTPFIAAEVLAAQGLGRQGRAAVVAVARRLRVSVWALLAAARGRRRGDLPSLASPLVSPQVRAFSAEVAHPWVREAAGLPPARRLQIRALANAQLYRGDCRRRRQADLVYPLLSQPVAELCLSLPISLLAAGDHDRSLAREAFAGRVPDRILARRSKGSLSAWYAQLAAASADTLRPWLLDGVLADAGLLDRSAVDRALTPEELVWRPAANELFCAAAVEAWVRYWQGRAPDSPQALRAP